MPEALGKKNASKESMDARLIHSRVLNLELPDQILYIFTQDQILFIFTIDKVNGQSSGDKTVEPKDSCITGLWVKQTFLLANMQLHLAMSVVMSVSPSNGHISELPAVSAIMPLPNLPILSWCVSSRVYEKSEKNKAK